MLEFLLLLVIVVAILALIVWFAGYLFGRPGHIVAGVFALIVFLVWLSRNWPANLNV